MSITIDLKKELKAYYAPNSQSISVLNVPEMNFLMVDGRGNPNTSQAYVDAVSALYQVAYGIRALIKKRTESAYTVMPLEGLWWSEDMRVFTADDKDQWQWTMMILQPNTVSEADFQEAQAILRKKKEASPALESLRFAPYHEGWAAQWLHQGAYADEAPNIQRLHQYIEAQGYRLAGKHHEIYLSDPRKVPPQKLKTILRQAFDKG